MKILKGLYNEEMITALDKMTPKDIFYKGFREDDVELVKAGIERGFDIEGLFTRKIYHYFFIEENGNILFRFEERTKISDFFLSNYLNVIQEAWNNMNIGERLQASLVWNNVPMFVKLDKESSFIEAFIYAREYQHSASSITLLSEALDHRAYSIGYYLINDVKLNINEMDPEGNTLLDIMLKERDDSGFPINDNEFDPYDPEWLKPELQVIGMIGYLKSKGAKKSSELK